MGENELSYCLQGLWLSGKEQGDRIEELEAGFDDSLDFTRWFCMSEGAPRSEPGSLIVSCSAVRIVYNADVMRERVTCQAMQAASRCAAYQRPLK
jgi:hypothetical protein